MGANGEGYFRLVGILCLCQRTKAFYNPSFRFIDIFHVGTKDAGNMPAPAAYSNTVRKDRHVKISAQTVY